ncbi:MAG: C4-dicarboxylate ABC transporter substrate-binding protein [Rhodobacteraceae bacterium]|uniref:TRAP transporter substrate-binding protein DctP n=1 Tax=Salipiger thiooxidans TaxID=282683 RepID=UPI001A905145|nr:TRAP transporter substrate-binding protein DctP [Salipiger thiooxidans]MBN8188335.1 TRAP transporter substrate-binding protein DctP [Salipiger thiooxidans]MBR9838762.1 C4-dicarboxylate ABC transporter substrate-binding protein [Paracoccaceae bacterium]
MNKLVQTTAATALAVCVAGTASAQDTVELSMATPWAGGHWLEIGAKSYARNVEDLTEGRVKINVFPAGALGPALDVTETVQMGIADMGHAWGGYDWSVDRTSALFGGWPGGPTPEEYMMWMYNGNGLELWKEWRADVFDVVAIPCGVTETEVFMHSHKKVQTPEDLQGLKLRTSSAWAEIAPKLGVSTVTLPGSEVFSALERQVVDAIEWGGPGGNLQEGFDKIAPYMMMPGVHSRAAVHDCIFNETAWNKIPESDQKLMEIAGRLTMLDTYLGYAKMDLTAFETLKTESPVEMVKIDQSLVEAATAASNEWAVEQSASNEWFKKVYEDQSAFLEGLSGLSEFRFAPGSR